MIVGIFAIRWQMLLWMGPNSPQATFFSASTGAQGPWAIPVGLARHALRKDFVSIGGDVVRWAIAEKIARMTLCFRKPARRRAFETFLRLWRIEHDLFVRREIKNLGR